MTDWKYNLYLADLRDDMEDENIEKIVTTIRDRLILLQDEIKKSDADYYIASNLQDNVDDFKEFDFEIDHDDQIEAFDEIMSDLYDLADSELIWINTMDDRMDGIGKP